MQGKAVVVVRLEASDMATTDAAVARAVDTADKATDAPLAVFFVGTQQQVAKDKEGGKGRGFKTAEASCACPLTHSIICFPPPNNHTNPADPALSPICCCCWFEERGAAEALHAATARVRGVAH